MREFDAWSFVRKVLDRGTAIERDSEAQGRGYEVHSAHLDKVSREFAVELRPYLASVPADDGTPVSEEWLRSVGFLEYSTSEDIRLIDLRNLVTFNRSRQTSAVTWWIGGSIGPVTDMPTRGHVRRLCAALGIPLKE